MINIKKVILPILIGVSMFIKIDSLHAYDNLNIENIDGTPNEISNELNNRYFKQSDEIVLIGGGSMYDSVSVSPLAFLKNAPVVVNKSSNMGNLTRKYIDNSNVKKVTIVGGYSAVSWETEQLLVKKGISVERIHGQDRYATSLNIARKIYRQQEFDKAFLISDKIGFENAISIYAYAAKNNYPIIWVSSDDVESSLDFLESKSLKKIYMLGVEDIMTSDMISKYDNLESLDTMGQTTTNIDLINELYSKDSYDKLYTANMVFGPNFKNYDYMSLGVIAAKEDIPILVVNETFSKSHEKFLDSKKVKTLIEIGKKVEPYSAKDFFSGRTFVSVCVLSAIIVVLVFRAIKFEAINVKRNKI
ncbi:MAG: cell wall-binding repeat-containing protein [Clostridioides sp.]|jgi:putative cell wall-binding protein|nr:cell wall-binding repeat-containing protein [Clostridioides sp.]